MPVKTLNDLTQMHKSPENINSKTEPGEVSSATLLECFYNVYHHYSNGEYKFHAGRWDNPEDAKAWAALQPDAALLVVVKNTREVCFSF